MALNGINTLEYVQRLEQVGVPREQAEVQASIFYEIINSELAKKRDLEEVKVELKRDIKDIDLKIEHIRSELKRDMADLKRDISTSKKDMIIWLGGIIVVCFGLLVGLSKLGLLQPVS